MDPESDDDWSEAFNERPLQSAQNHDCEAISDEWASVYQGGVESKQSRPAHSHSCEPFDGDVSFDFDSQSQSREIGGSSPGILVCIGATSAGTASDSAPGAASTADRVLEKKASKTRPFGSIGSAILRGVMNSMNVNADPATTPGTIEYARECKKTKIEERNKLQSKFLEFTPGRQTSTTTVPMDTMIFFAKVRGIVCVLFRGGRYSSLHCRLLA